MNNIEKLDYTSLPNSLQDSGETNKLLTRVNNSVEIFNEKTKNEPYFVLGSVSMAARLVELGMGAGKIDDIMSARRFGADHGLDVDFAVYMGRSDSVKDLLGWSRNEGQGIIGDEMIDLMERKVLPGFEPEDINGIYMQQTDEMLFEKMTAIDSSDSTPLKWALDCGTLKFITQKEHNIEDNIKLDLYLEDRFQDYLWAKLGIGFEVTKHYLDEKPETVLSSVISKEAILQKLPNIDSNLLQELLLSKSNDFISITNKINHEMLPNWKDFETRIDNKRRVTLNDARLNSTLLYSTVN